MRTLNLHELEDKIRQYSDEIRFSDLEYLNDKITKFLNFLNSQPISKQILNRIEEEFSEINGALPPINYNNLDNKTITLMKSSLNTHERQGAFGYFNIKRLGLMETKYSNHYINVASLWYRFGGDYHKVNNAFQEYFFNPFIDLLQWYIYDSTARDDKDYFSKNEIEELNIKLDKLSEDLSLYNLQRDNGQQIIFEEIEELKELLLFLNKKNWKQVITGKLGDLTAGAIITSDNASKAFKSLLDAGIIPGITN